MLAFLFWATCALVFSQCPETHKIPEDIIQGIEARLRADFLIQQGEMRWVSFLDKGCSEDEKIGCHFDNPASPYSYVALPPGPGENVTSNLQVLQGSAGFTDEEGSQFRLRADEIVMIIGCSPPPMKFYSFQHYIMDHWNRYRNGFDHIAGSAGKSVNLMSIKTETGSPFESPFALFMAMDKDRLADVHRVVSSYLAEGFNNTLQLSQRMYQKESEGLLRDTILNYGLQQNADTFSIVLRVAFPKTDDSVMWLKQNPNFQVYRLTPLIQKKTENVFDPPPILPPDTESFNEHWLQPAVDFLKRRVIETVAKDGVQRSYIETIATIGRSDPFIPVWGGTCIYGSGFPYWEAISASNCQLDTRDTTYITPLPRFNLKNPGDFLYVIGADHTSTNISTYCNFAFYNFWIKTSILNVHDDQMKGSAVSFLEGTEFESLAHNLLVVRIAREGECLQNEKFCFEIPLGEFYWKKRPPASFLGFIERAYLNHKTKEAPDDRTMIHPQYIMFRANVTQKELQVDQDKMQIRGFWIYLWLKATSWKVFGWRFIVRYGWTVVLLVMVGSLFVGPLLVCGCCLRRFCCVRRRPTRKLHES